ncbi:IS110 family transposase [Actinomadura sp. NBRC 104412]|uniref:IS110 family transposase n=1 Tax=Actinomadura sp. NBRC 104412 TaxID=3032203 RepID=UPI002554A963|nr:IS110 family transposase [Actinomadura sp. NBRC 104412]
MTKVTVPQVWAGVDAGKAHHHCVTIDADSARLLSRRAGNDEAELLELITHIRALGKEITWAIDLNSGGGTLLISLLPSQDKRLIYIPGRTVHHASGAYRSNGKTDAKDAFVIADQTRIRRDQHPLSTFGEIASDLRILTARRADLAADHTRAINRPRAQLPACFPALKRAFDYSNSKAAQVLPTGNPTPATLRHQGRTRLESSLHARTVREAAVVAQRAIETAQAQHSAVTGGKTAAGVLTKPAGEVIALNTQIAETDTAIKGPFRRHRHAAVITSLPSIGPLLEAELITATGGDMAASGSADRLASLAPVPHDSGRVRDNLHRPRRHNRRPLRMFFMSALVSIRCCPASPTFHKRKRAKNKHHTQAVTALARRRLNVLWALIRDNRPYTVDHPSTLPTAA